MINIKTVAELKRLGFPQKGKNLDIYGGLVTPLGMYEPSTKEIIKMINLYSTEWKFKVIRDKENEIIYYQIMMFDMHDNLFQERRNKESSIEEALAKYLIEISQRQYPWYKKFYIRLILLIRNSY